MSEFRFGPFVLDTEDRRVRRGSEPVEVSGRYFDALVLLLRDAGKLVTKDRFMDEVWRGIPVTDEALTQCVRTLRRQLGDDAASPRFIETVPRHGYRFIAPVECADGVTTPVSSPSPAQDAADWRGFWLLGGAGTLGGALAGLLGGLLYGFAGIFQPLPPGGGAASLMLVLASLTVLVATLGAAGVSFGIAAGSLVGRADERPPMAWPVLGGAVGGFITGAAVKLVGIDTLALLFGQEPGDITGAGEGVLLGGAVGFGAWLALRGGSLRRAAMVGGLAAAAVGALAPLIGGRMMAGSLALVAQAYPQSRLRLGDIGALLGERGFGPIAQSLTGAVEGFAFGFCIVAALVLALRRRPATPAGAGAYGRAG